MTDAPLSGAALALVQGETDRIMARFSEAGATHIAPAALQPAQTLLDLYGEDIRARAFVTRAGYSEHMLRPDFTVPVVQRHMEVGAEPARYAYCGPVWRRQSGGRDAEYLQAGFEVFDGSDIAAVDAEVFALIRECVSGANLQVATGDMGLVLAAIDGLETTPARRAALRRHIWRPKRFHRLLKRFSSSESTKTDLIGAARAGNVEQLIAEAGKHVGLRSPAEIEARVVRLLEEADATPLSKAQVDLIDAILDLRGNCLQVLGELQDMVVEAPALSQAVETFEKRLQALDRNGVTPDELPFEGAFGRTTLEYYDGFVFGFFAPDRPELPVIASGGRYDALTEVLGNGTGIPAAGGIIRPEMLASLKGGSC